jgi:hypothetical protein
LIATLISTVGIAILIAIATTSLVVIVAVCDILFMRFAITNLTVRIAARGAVSASSSFSLQGVDNTKKASFNTTWKHRFFPQSSESPSV